MIELQLGTSAVGGRTPYLIHHIEGIEVESKMGQFEIVFKSLARFSTQFRV